MQPSPINATFLDNLKPELFELVQTATVKTGMPYASMLVDRKTGVVVAKDFNTSLITFDPSDQCSVAAIRKAERALETGDLSHLCLFSMFEPTILSFDLALFAQINTFAWCINAADAPAGHYVITDYSPTVYAAQHQNAIAITPGHAQEEALALLGNLPVHVPKGFRLGTVRVD